MARYFFDLDGVLALYEKAAKAHNVPVREAKHIPGIYEELEVDESGRAVVEALENLYPGSVYFLTTSPIERPESFTEKARWITRHFPELKKRLVIASDKSACGKPGDYLIDDHPTWNGADGFGGTVIPFTGNWSMVLDLVSK